MKPKTPEPHAYLDTNVIIRLVTGDDPTKQAAAQGLFERVEAGVLTVTAPVTVLADAVYVLSSPRLYALARPLVSAVLTRLIRIPQFRVQHRRALLRALALYGASHALDFGDAYLVASMEQAGATSLYSYDRDFDQFAGITRQDP